MKIFGLLLVKNEVDVIGYVLNECSKWADKIYILDNGSTDGTWELVQSMANDIIVPFKQDFSPYLRGLRGQLFQEYKKFATEDDWWWICDADELFVENPKEFLANIPKNRQIVSKKSLHYFITNEDVEEYEYTGDFAKDIDHIKYFGKECWTEPRFFRHRKGLKWDVTSNEQYPPKAGIQADQFITCKHYRSRSPQQIQARLDERNALENKKNGKCFKHVTQKDWHELLKPRAELLFDDGKEETYNSLKIRNKLKKPACKRVIINLLIKLGLYK